MTQLEEYIAAGLKLTPSGRINHHHWYQHFYGLCSSKDSTWIWYDKPKNGDAGRGEHTCCGSKKAYCHKVGCKNRIRLEDLDDDLSDLNDGPSKN